MQEQKKPETKTLLRARELVDKTHPQIEFRGKLDSLVAKTVETQIVADELKDQPVGEDLEDLLAFLRLIQRVEVTGEPLGEVRLLGLSSANLRHDSQQVKKAFGIDHPVPGRGLGKMGAALNSLRTAVREVELSALRAFGESRLDIAEGLNRLSSAVYIILCRRVSGWYEQAQQPAAAKAAPVQMGELEQKAQQLWQEVGEAAKMVLSTSCKDRVSSRTMSVVQVNGIFYFQTDRMLPKYEQLKNNPRAALCMGNIQLEGVCKELGHPLENPAFCGLYQKHFANSFERYSFLQEERVFAFTPTFCERWLYVDGIPHIERFDFEKGEYMMGEYN